MKGTINTWKDSVCFYGHRFDLRDERIMSVRQTKDLYEMYYRVDREQINFLYIEKDAYQSIYHLLQVEGWEDIMVTKYLRADDHKPSFLLKAQKNDYVVTYYFDIEKHIQLKAVVHYKGSVYEDWSVFDEDVQEGLKHIYRIIERYVYSYYKTNIIIDKTLHDFVERKSKHHLADNLTLITETLIHHFHHCIEIHHKSQEYATSTSISIYKKKFHDPVVQAVVWFTLKDLNEMYALKQQENKDALILWLKEECNRAKNVLTEDQRKRIQEEGMDWLEDE